MPTHRLDNRWQKDEAHVHKKPPVDSVATVHHPPGVNPIIVQKARLHPEGLSPAVMLQLQRIIGNRGVLNLIEPRSHAPAISRKGEGVLPFPDVEFPPASLAAWTPDKIIYASMVGNNVGSIYFQDLGRIRLLHEHGPKIDETPVITANIISGEMWDSPDFQMNRSNGFHYTDKKGRRKKMSVSEVLLRYDMKPAEAGAGAVGDRFIEFLEKGEGGWSIHPSRGLPRSFAIEKQALGAILRAVFEGDSGQLRKVWNKYLRPRGYKLNPA